MNTLMTPYGRGAPLLIWTIALYLACYTPLLAQQQPFNCDSTFLLTSVQGNDTEIRGLDFSANPINMIDVGTSQGYDYNGAGFRSEDGYVYAIKTGTNELVRIGQGGVVVDLGTVSGLQWPFWSSLDYTAGDILSNGHLFVHRSESSRYMYEIDVTSSPPQMIQRHRLNRSIQLQDFAYSPLDDKIYGVGNDGRKYMIDPTNWTVMAIGSNAPAAAYGGAFVNHRAEVYVYRNNDGALLRIDYGPNGTGSGDVTLVAYGPSSNSIDGASCAAYYDPICKTAVLNPHIMYFKRS